MGGQRAWGHSLALIGGVLGVVAYCAIFYISLKELHSDSNKSTDLAASQTFVLTIPVSLFLVLALFHSSNYRLSSMIQTVRRGPYIYLLFSLHFIIPLLITGIHHSLISHKEILIKGLWIFEAFYSVYYAFIIGFMTLLLYY